MKDNSAASKAIADAQAMMRLGDTAGALQHLTEANDSIPKHLNIVMNLALVYRSRGELGTALKFLDAALAIDPYSFLALLSKGSTLEQLGRPRQAAEIYRNAIKIAPSDEQLPASLLTPLTHARSMVKNQSEEMADFLLETVSDLLEDQPPMDRQRALECLELSAGTRKAYQSEPLEFQYPRLPAIPFFERTHFPWFTTLEGATDMIVRELKGLIHDDMPGFSPYVTYAPGTPENQFASLNNSDDWRSLWLWKDGERQQGAIDKCPNTSALLKELPLCDQDGFAPTALFSALAPRTRIPPHTGSTNTRLLVHLPLILPGPAGFRVGNEVRSWKLGEAWAFDDTIEHEAWNDADQTRIIMIFDIWNPLLSEGERDIVRSLLLSKREWLRET